MENEKKEITEIEHKLIQQEERTGDRTDEVGTIGDLPTSKTIKLEGPLTDKLEAQVALYMEARNKLIDDCQKNQNDDMKMASPVVNTVMQLFKLWEMSDSEEDVAERYQALLATKKGELKMRKIRMDKDISWFDEVMLVGKIELYEKMEELLDGKDSMDLKIILHEVIGSMVCRIVYAEIEKGEINTETNTTVFALKNYINNYIDKLHKECEEDVAERYQALLATKKEN